MNVQSHEKITNKKHDITFEQKFKKLGFQTLTDIQKKAIPVILQKKDTLIIAPTGSGKTETAVIPIFSFVNKSKEKGKIKVLYITPLRALNRDVFKRIIRYAEHEKLSIKIRHGDTSQYERKKIVNNPPDILITTPETLVVMLVQSKILDSLDSLEWVVIDEVHELMGNERGSQLTISLERLQLNSKFPITRIGLSASIGNTITAAKFVVGTKRKFRIIKDDSIRKYDVDVKYVNGTIMDVAQAVVEYKSKFPKETMLLFTNTRGEAEFLASALRDKSSMKIGMHHGSLSREVREETEGKLREGRSEIVICTSSLELGLDIGSIEQVIHYGSPRQVSKLVQRIGRSRHKRGESAKGLILTNNFDDEFESKAILDKVFSNSIEEQNIHSNPLDVLGHHLTGLALQLNTSVTVNQALSIITEAYPFRDLTTEQIVDVLELLDSTNLLWFEDEKMEYNTTRKTLFYYYQNLSTIPDILKFRVFDSIGKRTIGYLDQRFVGDHGEPGSVFVLKGTKWSILNVDEKGFMINVEPFRTQGTVVPYWEGESIPIDQSIAKRVGQLRTGVKKRPSLFVNDIIESLEIPIPNEDTIVIESVKSSGLVIHCCFGTKINSTLAILVSSILSSILGLQVETRSDAYRIMLKSSIPISKDVLVDIFKDDYDLSDILISSLSGTHNINWKVWSVAKRFGIVGREAVYQQKTARFLYERYANTPLAKEAVRELYHDKFDIAGSEQVLKEIKADKITIQWNDISKFTRLAEPILDHTTKYYSTPTSLDKGLLKMVKERLLKTKHRLLCARCGIWQMTYLTEEIKSIKSCPYCKARQITSTFYGDHDLSKIIQDKYKGKKITQEQEHKYKRAWKVASLIENFGTVAILVLSGYGVGADTAGRILRNMISEKDVYRQIYEAERLYVMTRGFWD